MATKQQWIRLNIQLKKTVEIREEQMDGGRQRPVETGCGECDLINRQP